MKKIIITLISGFLLITASGCGKRKYYVPLGSFTQETIEAISSTCGLEVKNYFTSKAMQSGELFKIIDSNAAYYLDGNKYPFHSVAEKAKFFIFNIGLDDILPSMTINPSKNIIDFDDELVTKQLEIFEYHLYHSLDALRDINSLSPILLLGSFNEFQFDEPERLLYSSIISRINKTILSAGADHKTRYVSLINLEERLDEDFKKNKAQLIASIVKEYI